MATSTRRRKPAPADLPASDTASPDAVAAVPADTESAAAAPAAAKRLRAARKTPAARKRSAATTGQTQADLAAPADAVAASASASEPPADLSADQPGDQSAETPADMPLSRPARPPRPPRPRRKPEPAATAPSQAAPAERSTPADDTQAPDAAPATAAEAVVDELPAHQAQPAAPTGEMQPEAVAPAATLTPTEADKAPEPPPPPRPATSRLGLADDGLQRLLHWQTGERCPDTLAQAVRRWRLAGLDGPLALGHLDDLAELLAIAARTGHTVDVEDAVWTHLARLGDLQARIAHLESRHPQGLDPAVQPEGSLLAGWRPCQLEAAFFAACVGRCVLADEPALQPEEEVLLATRLVMQHFGATAPVVQAPAELHAGWQAAWARVHPQPADGTAALTLITPAEPAPAGTELLVLDQRTEPQPALAESAAAQAAAWLWVLAPADLLDRPEALPLLAAVDQLRQGGLASWQHDGDSAALAPLLLARRFADVAPQWPAWQPAERSTPASAEEPAAGADLAQRLARWQRTGFLADSDQLALRRALHAAWASARAANAAALPGLLQEALAAGAGRIVVFSEDATGLPGLADALSALGLPAEALPTAGAPRHAEQALRAFRDATEPRILLVADGPQGAESRIGVQLAPPLVIHLDTPWAAGALDRRLQRVRAAATQRQVPVWQLLPDGCLMARRARWLAAGESHGDATRLDGALLRGTALEAWQAELAALV